MPNKMMISFGRDALPVVKSMEKHLASRRNHHAVLTMEVDDESKRRIVTWQCFGSPNNRTRTPGFFCAGDRAEL